MSHQLADLPSVDEILRGMSGQLCATRFGHEATVSQIRSELGVLRERLRSGAGAVKDRAAATEALGRLVLEALEMADTPFLRRVFNLTGTVLHTNLGRAIYAGRAIAAATVAMRNPIALEYDLETGKRGQRDDAVQRLVTELTGAEDACLVNNNAAAVFVVLAALAQGKDTIVSRGELIEIGGAFRLPDIMVAAGTRLREVGTTNRTHPRDYGAAISQDTGLLMKVHSSNFEVRGFTSEVTSAELAPLARRAGIPLVEDLGSGTLVDMSRWGLSRERMVQDALLDGADIVTFSGDKLLGGPQAGFIVGRRDLVRACASHPIKRAVRLDKVRLVALEATLKLYRDVDSLPRRLPTLGVLTRDLSEMTHQAQRLAPAVSDASGLLAEIVETRSQYGSGALPLATIPSVAVRLSASGGSADRLAKAFRRLPIPVIGRIENGAVLFDLRCLDDEPAFVAQLQQLDLSEV